MSEIALSRVQFRLITALRKVQIMQDKNIPRRYVFTFCSNIDFFYTHITAPSARGCIKMRIAYQKVMSSLAKRRIPCASACVFETIHCVRDDKMKAYFYFETASNALTSRAVDVWQITPLRLNKRAVYSSIIW